MGIFLVSQSWVTSLRALRCKKEVPVSFIGWMSTLDVFGEVWLLRGSVDTLRAGVGLLPGVRAEMAAQVTPVHESSPAERTHQSRHRADRQPTTAITDCPTQTLLWEERASVTLSPPTASAAKHTCPYSVATCTSVTSNGKKRIKEATHSDNTVAKKVCSNKHTENRQLTLRQSSLCYHFSIFTIQAVSR